MSETASSSPTAAPVQESSSESPSAQGGNLIVLSAVSKTYPARAQADPVKALRKVSLFIPRGSRVAIRGESGSGKSTLLCLLGGLDVATKGQVLVDGEDLTTMSERELARYRARKVGFIFQTFNLLPDLTAAENVELPMDVGSLSSQEKHDRALELLDAVGMRKRAHHRPGRLSGGEQQRVAIARSLANQPALVLADEPTGNLDKKSRKKVVELLKKINREFGTTMVIVTHDPNVANECDKVHVIKYGKIVREYVPEGASRPESPDEAHDDEEDRDDEKDDAPDPDEDDS